MFRIPRSHPYPPTIDLGTVRETLAYIHDDASRVPGLEKLTAALETAMAEATAAEHAVKGPVFGAMTHARFFPRRGMKS
jgi:hypothetical protein